ncbi:Crp/Fnr family transcriptional regulator [Methylobacterium sp. E-041]|uniref:Crp/Fnr family transcriptional regulator n=1 Tax=Methylobacterium sp. E-041 TaxID=2836573 RepID=UPI001FBB946D|nr:Crp/Fnr family transcriptional regulator [Methylobacterium sp. E-041]MCJ2104136.1 Crp/Fnr family transcriptional regulator [Methylobacterium sp. E-041]
MKQPLQATYRNRLLVGLRPADFAWVQNHLTPVVLRVGDVPMPAATPLTHVYFVEQGIVSLVARSSDGEQAEIGLVGYEGVVGLPLILGSDRAPYDGQVQMAGLAWAMPAEALFAMLQRSAAFSEGLLRYAQASAVQVAGTALANARYTLAARLARWLLMCHDRVEGDDLPTTHRFLSVMLGVNRTGVSEAMAVLERAGVIATKRGTITIRDREKLIAQAGACYGMPEAEYDRLLGPTTSTPTV